MFKFGHSIIPNFPCQKEYARDLSFSLSSYEMHTLGLLCYRVPAAAPTCSALLWSLFCVCLTLFTRQRLPPCFTMSGRTSFSDSVSCSIVFQLTQNLYMHLLAYCLFIILKHHSPAQDMCVFFSLVYLAFVGA